MQEKFGFYSNYHLQEFSPYITEKSCQLLIIGAGAAGIMSAITASKAGIKDIVIISKVLPINSHTASAKGGINASLGNVAEDNWLWHAFDTIKGGDYLADTDAVEILCQNANDAIIELEHFGVVFSRSEDGKIAQRAYGGQTSEFGKGKVAYRACYSKDKTGYTILNSLYQQALKLNIKFLSETLVVDLLADKATNKCYGCIAIDHNSGKVIAIESLTTIIATGGYSQIYRNSTSSTICTGDGTALAFQNGIALEDMEFVQFHPTGIAGYGFLISEATRAEGGYLLNCNGDRFMKNYAPNLLELASRDVVSQAIASEINEGRGCGEDKKYINLDLRHLSKKTLEEKLPGVVELVKKFLKIDPQESLIPICPSAHYNMGGIPTNTRCQVINFNEELLEQNLEIGSGNNQQSCFSNLFAIGEAACVSVHGANRLGCNSLLDLLVFGKIAGNEAVKIAQNLANQGNITPGLTGLKEKMLARMANVFAVIVKISQLGQQEKNKIGIKINQIKLELQENNSNNLAVFRNYQSLKQGLDNNLQYQEKLQEIFSFSDAESLTRSSKQNKTTIDKTTIELSWNQLLIDYYELQNLIDNAIASNISAIKREESRGSHFRQDFPLRNDKDFLAHSLVIKCREEEFFEQNSNIKINLANYQQYYKFALTKVRNHSNFSELNIQPTTRKY